MTEGYPRRMATKTDTGNSPFGDIPFPEWEEVRWKKVDQE